MKRTLALMMTIGLSATAGLAACGGGGGGSKASDAPPPLQMTVTHVDEYKQFGDKVPDGQYVVVMLDLKNTSTQTLNLAPGDFPIEKVEGKAEDKYSQKNEQGLSGPFTTLYGMDKRDRLLDSSSTAIHPKQDVERYIIYMLPNDAELTSFHVTYKPMSLSVPLTGADTVVTDHRSPAAQATPVADDKSAEPQGDGAAVGSSGGNNAAPADNGSSQ